MFLNSDRRDPHSDASPEGARRAPPRGDEWRQLNGALGAASRLSALSQAPPKITRPVTNKQPKRKKPNFPDPRTPTTPGDKDTAQPIAGVDNRGNQNGVQYGLAVSRTLTCTSFNPAAPYVNASPHSHHVSPQNLSRIFELPERNEGSRHSVQGVGASVRYRTPSREQHPSPPLMHRPIVYPKGSVSPNPLPELTTPHAENSKNNPFPNTEINNYSPIASPHTDTLTTNRTCRLRRPRAGYGHGTEGN